jgi:hypothetical protein
VRINVLIPLLLGLTLAACVETTTVATTVPTSVAAGDSARVGPGPRPVSSSLAVETFRAACIGTRPDFAAAPAVLRARGFRQNTSTGTYYSQTDNLSVKLIQQAGGTRCSMVFGSTEDPQRVLAAGGSDILFQPSSEQSGQLYWRAFISGGRS